MAERTVHPGTGRATSLRCADGSVQRAGSPVVRGLEFTAEPGRLVVLAGPSGCGKSTLLAYLAGFPVPGGEGLSASGILLGGSRAAVFQEPSTQTVMDTVWNEVAFACENHLVPSGDIPGRVGRALEAVGARDWSPRDPATLSGGQLQRVSLAAALACRPDWLLLDEPLAQVDAPAARMLVSAVGSAVEAGLGAVVVDHHPWAWEGAADLLVVLDGNGRQVFSGDFGQARRRERELAAHGLWPRGGPSGFPPPPASEGGPAVLEARGLRVRWRKRSPVSAVPGIRLEPGACRRVAGPNGAGKSAALATLAGLLPPAAGTVEGPVGGGRRWHRLPASLRAAAVGIQLQNPAHLMRCPTVRGELALEGHPAADVDGLLERWGLAGLGSRHPLTLSGGELRRLAVLLALPSPLRPRKLALLDEPTAGLDHRSWSIVVRELLAFLSAGGAVALATHDDHLARALGAAELAVLPAGPAGGAR